MKAQVLIVDDEALIRGTLQRALGDRFATQAVGSLRDADQALSQHHFDLAIIDLKLGDGDGLTLLRRLSQETPETKVIVVTAHGCVESAVTAMKLGAYDFVKKPFELDDLLVSAGNALHARALEERVAYHEARERSQVDEPRGASRAPAMQRLEREIAIVAAQPVPIVLIVGETGTGKTHVARRLHRESKRASGPFVELNVGTVGESQVELELFGREQAAPTPENKPGLVEIADGGTLFLDEIGDLGPSAQLRLLNFLESFAFRPLGSAVTRSVDVRVVVATNRDLRARVEAGAFRADLYYRINGLTLTVPPLRQRAEDFPELVTRFTSFYARRFGKAFTGVSDDAIRLLQRSSWPGNVRELQAVIQRAVLMNEGARLEPQHLPIDLVGAALDPVHSALTEEARIPTLDEVEVRYMRAVLSLTGGNKVRAAEHLGITRQTLAKRIGEEPS